MNYNTYSMNKSIEDAERKYMEIIEQERREFKKKEFASKEIITEISKRLKVSTFPHSLRSLTFLQLHEKRIGEESKLSVEYKKKYDGMKRKLEKVGKEKLDTVN